MVYTARIDVAPVRSILILITIVVFCMIGAIILGQLGPDLLVSTSFSVYDCPDNNHFKFDSTCSGTDLSLGTWSRRFDVEPKELNRHWYCVATLYTKTNSSGFNSLNVYVLTEGRNYDDDDWKLVSNVTHIIKFECTGGEQKCPSVLLKYQPVLSLPLYTVSILLLLPNGEHIVNLADVELRFYEDNPEFSKMSLIMKVIFLGLSIGLFAFHYLKLKGKKSYWEAWTDEQRLFVFLILGLVGLNNPFYPLEFVTKGWFLSFLGSLLELLFMCILFCFWFIMAQKLRSSDGAMTFTTYIKFSFVIIMCFAVVASCLYGFASSIDEQSPLFGLPSHALSIQILYYLTLGFYVFLVIIFFSTLVVALQQRVYLRVRFAFFVIPTFVVILSVIVYMFFGIIGTFGRDSPSFVYFLVLYNLYVYVLLWGYWPVEIVFEDRTGPSEATKMFAEATQPTYT